MTTEFNTNSKALIIGLTDTGERIPAASGRISTQPGTALEILELSKGDNVVLTGGQPNGQSGNTNLIKVERIAR